MRSAYLLASVWLVLSAAAPLAQENRRSPAQEPPSGSAGPVMDRARQQDKVIDDLYKELMTPVPSREQSGQSTEPTR